MTTIAEQLRRMGWKPEHIATATINGKPLAESDAVPKKRSDGWPGYRSKWEAMYAMVLEDQKAAGEILSWDYEAVTLKLTESTIVGGKRTRAISYTADFACWLPDGRLRLIEVKGYRRTDGINRYKLAKDRFRLIEFVMVSRANGSWEVIL